MKNLFCFIFNILLIIKVEAGWTDSNWGDFIQGVDSSIVITDFNNGELQLSGIRQITPDSNYISFEWYGVYIPEFSDHASGDSIGLVYSFGEEAPNGTGAYLLWIDSEGHQLSNPIFLQSDLTRRGCIDGYGRVILSNINEDSVIVRRYTSEGILVDENVANTDYTDVGNPTVSCNDHGDFVVSWKDKRVNGVYTDIYARLYNSDGTASTPDFQANDSPNDNSFEGATYSGISNSGKVAIIWKEFRVGIDTQTSVWCQQYDMQGALIDSNFRVNDYNSDGVTSAKVYMSDSGEWFVLWEQFRDVWAQFFDSSGVRIGSNRQVRDQNVEVGRGVYPVGAFDSGGNILIVWRDDRLYPDGPPPPAEEWWPWDVYGQYFNQNFIPLGQNQKLNHAGHETIQYVGISSGIDSQFIVTWQDIEMTWPDSNYGFAFPAIGVWEHQEYLGGIYLSALHDFRDNVSPQIIHWDAVVEEGDSLSVWMRASIDSFDLYSIYPSWVAVDNMQEDNLPSGQYFQYRVALSTDSLGAGPVFHNITIGDSTLSVRGQTKPFIGQKTNLYLNQNYPNPFNPSTTIEYDLPDQSDVSVIVYDIAGREVQTLISTSQSAGRYKISWDGTSKEGQQVAAGMYFARLQADEYSSVVKMVYLR
ncbi:MAG: T9SS type A sorting domain-containing protein [FCB group bacterium]|nr:T9SS type A sorting domain-containing protein [FCB group bacterium]